MKIKLIILTLAIFLNASLLIQASQPSIVDDSDDGAEIGLDLAAVAEILKESENLGEFEKALNDPEGGINNVDLDENGEVDYLKVHGAAEDDTRLIMLQAVLGEDEGQDVATIAVEKEVNKYNLQIQGAPTLYGANYYIVPRYTNIGSWFLTRWLYRPNYRPYRSAFGWRAYPRWWRVRRPVTVGVYRTRTVKFVGRRNFTTSRTVRVKSVHKVKYKTKSSKLVKKKKVVRTNGNKTVVTKKGTKTTTNANGKKVTVKRGVRKTTNSKTGKTTVTRGKKKTVKTKKGKKTKVKKVKKKKN